MKNREFLNRLKLKEMVMTQINSWELILRKRGLSEKTIERKINNIGTFYAYITTRRYNKERIHINTISELAFEFVRDGYFNDDNVDNEGTYGYRRNIYYNIKEGFNYIYEDYFKDKNEVIKELTNEQKEILEELSRNKWFKIGGCERNTDNLNESIQVKLMKELGIKIYFDENSKPYALSHELAELIEKKKDKVLRDIRELLKKIDLSKIGEVEKYIDLTMLEDFYEVERIVGNNSGISKEITYRLYKDLLLTYVLGLTGKEIIEFKMKYISAFNYIEQEHNRLLLEYSQLKDSFLKMYNDIRKRNRDLLINKSVKKTA